MSGGYTGDGFKTVLPAEAHASGLDPFVQVELVDAR